MSGEGGRAGIDDYPRQVWVWRLQTMRKSTSTAARSNDSNGMMTDWVGANASVHGSRASTVVAWGRYAWREAT